MMTMHQGDGYLEATQARMDEDMFKAMLEVMARGGWRRRTPAILVWTVTSARRRTRGLASYARSVSAALGRRHYVLAVFPGPVRTRHAERHSPDNSRASRRMPPEQLARGIARLMRARRQRTWIPGAGNRAAGTIGHLCPLLAEMTMRRLILDTLEQKAKAAISPDR